MWKGLWALAVAAAALLGLHSLAQAQEPNLHLQIVPDSEFSNQQAVNTLMQPVSPFMQGNAQTTTSIAQIGLGNQATSLVEGTSNLSAIAQSGSNNRAAHVMQGNSSALLLAQGGTNNSVLQASVGDRNFQLVGISGSNNNIGYVQVGNDLAGALDVRNSHNSNVVALQTPASGNYLMPSGLRGLQNTTVVIVPGRMYVIPHRN